MLIVAPMVNANGFPDDAREAIARGEYYDRFYIFGDGSRLEDQVVDLTREFHVPASLLFECTKVARLAAWQWKRLLVQQSVSRWHQAPETIFQDLVADSADAGREIE